MANIAIYACFIAGTFAFVLPGFYLASRFGFTYFYIYLKKADVLPALKTSWRETSMYQWWLFSWSLGATVVFGICAVLIIELLKYGMTPDLASSFAYNVGSEIYSATLKVFCVVLFFRFFWFVEDTKKAQENEQLNDGVELDPA
jgi:hypothetical protein